MRTAERQETIAIDRVRLSEIRLGEARARVEEVTGAQLLAAQELAAARSRMRSLAVASYVRGGSGTSIAYVLEAKDPVEMIRRNALIDSAAVVHHNTATVYELAKAAASRELVEAIAAVDRQTSVHAQAQAEVEVLAVISAEHRFALDYGRQLLDLVTAAAPVAPSDIPRLYLDAYRQAASTLAKRMPACRVRWSAVAAIGKIESNHGRYRGTQLALNGDAYPRIIGIPLDGTNNTRAIPDSDLGRLDGDDVWDRAVGPMQFIPTTWQRLAQDGNGDGVLDPNNAYDATLATATYLCRSNPAGGLDTDEGLRPSFFAYNRSETYVENVLAWTSIYAAMDAELPQPPSPPPPPPPTPPARRR